LSYAIDEMPWTEASRILAEDRRLIFPVGALEQHGPHLPLGANLLIAQRVARALSDQLKILRAPAFSYGVTVDGGPFPGRAGLRRKTLHRAVNQLLERWDDDGVEHYIIITAHRFEPHLEALLMTPVGPSRKSVYDLYQIDVSDLVDADPRSEHAGELETSLMLHLAPDLVHMHLAKDFHPTGGELRKYTRRRAPAPPRSSAGVLGAPSRATPEKGENIFRRYVDVLARTIAAEVAGAEGPRGAEA
jgi:creatinine amidohydrolase